MTVPTDPYDFTNGATADAEQVDARFAPLYAALNHALDTDNLLASFLDLLGVSSGATVRRGKSVVAGAETRSNAAYGLLGTPDRVSNVVVPTDGLVLVSFDAIWSSSAVAARAALHIAGNQVKVCDGLGAAPSPQAAISHEAAITWDTQLTTCAAGLIGCYASSAYAGVSTGQIRGAVPYASSPTGAQMEVGGTKVNLGPTSGGSMPLGGWMLVDIPAGTYDFDVRFKCASGTVTVKNRKLQVITVGF